MDRIRPEVLQPQHFPEEAGSRGIAGDLRERAESEGEKHLVLLKVPHSRVFHKEFGLHHTIPKALGTF